MTNAQTSQASLSWCKGNGPAPYQLLQATKGATKKTKMIKAKKASALKLNIDEDHLIVALIEDGITS